MPAKGHADVLLDRLYAVPGTCSVTTVGSWVDAGPTAPVGDLDVVMVASELTPIFFQAAAKAAASLSADDLGYPGRRLLVNDTLGPLKFDEPDLVVLHLMLYDRVGHRDHVLKSSFTCYDWERSIHHRGHALSAVYPVFKLQPRDFTASRRGLRDYIADLERGGVSYRRYAPDGDCLIQKTEWRPLEGQRCVEFCYHIMRNLVANYVKLVTQTNRLFSPEELRAAWDEHLPELGSFKPQLASLHRAKIQHEPLPGTDAVRLARDFVAAFESHFQSTWGGARRVVFARHGATDLNTGEFLGSRRNPPVKNGTVFPVLDFVPDLVFSSPLLRAQQTAAALAPGKTAVFDERLAEIDYGLAEGLRVEQLNTLHPEMLSGWKKGEDPPFPGGENTRSVLDRLNAFLASLAKENGNTLVVTHNVVLRCLVGQFYGIPQTDWHKIRIDPLTQLEFVQRHGMWYPNLAPEVKAAITDGLVSWSPA